MTASHLRLQFFWVHFLGITNSILIITFEENKAIVSYITRWWKAVISPDGLCNFRPQVVVISAKKKTALTSLIWLAGLPAWPSCVHWSVSLVLEEFWALDDQVGNHLADQLNQHTGDNMKDKLTFEVNLLFPCPWEYGPTWDLERSKFKLWFRSLAGAEPERDVHCACHIITTMQCS